MTSPKAPKQVRVFIVLVCHTMISMQSATRLIPWIWGWYQVNPENLHQVYQW